MALTPAVDRASVALVTTSTLYGSAACAFGRAAAVAGRTRARLKRARPRLLLLINFTPPYVDPNAFVPLHGRTHSRKRILYGRAARVKLISVKNRPKFVGARQKT